MAKKAAKPAPKKSEKSKAKGPALQVGDNLKFKAYGQLDEDMEPIFKKGDILEVTKVEGEVEGGQLKVKAKVAGQKNGEIDTVYVPEEAEVFTGKVPAAKAAKEDDEEEAEEQDEEENEEAEEGNDEEASDEDADADDEQDADDEDAEETDEDDEEEEKSSKKGKAVAKGKKPPARTEEEAEQEEIIHTPSVKKLLKKGDIVEVAKSLADASEQSAFQLGGVLAEIQKTKAYMELGYTKDVKEKRNGKTVVVTPLEQFVNAELGVEYRKAMYHVDIYKQFSKVEGLDEVRLAKIGWTKLRLIAKALRKGEDVDLEDLLENAEKMTRDDLEEHVRTTYVGGGASDKVKKVKYTFTAFADQADFIGANLEKASGLVEDGDLNKAFLHIMTEWALMQDGSNVPLKDAVKALEDRYGVKLEEVKSEGKAVKVAPKAETKKLPAPAKSDKKVTKISDAKKKPAPAKPAAKKAVKANGKKKAA